MCLGHIWHVPIGLGNLKLSAHFKLKSRRIRVDEARRAELTKQVKSDEAAELTKQVESTKQQSWQISSPRSCYDNSVTADQSNL